MASADDHGLTLEQESFGGSSAEDPDESLSFGAFENVSDEVPLMVNGYHLAGIISMFEFVVHHRFYLDLRYTIF